MRKSLDSNLLLWSPEASKYILVLIDRPLWNHITFFFLIYFADRASQYIYLNRLTPNDPYMGRTAPLNSKRCILYIYSTNIDTEYFKHALYSLFFLFKMQFVS